ncbi:MAG: penicillin acylase family protein [Desulfosalsimonadaceae bacterium]
MPKRIKSGVSGAIALLLSVFFVVLFLHGCTILDYRLQRTVHRDSGSVELPGLRFDAYIRRDEMGIPVVQAVDMDDLAYASGYAMASDRLAQMVSYSLLGQGRLAEMAGPPVLDIDVYVRTLDLPGAARKQFEQLPPKYHQILARFSEGVNAYLEIHKDRLPLDFKLSGYTPEAWQPIHSLYIFNVLNLGLSFNLHEEVAFLNLARVLGPQKAAWLFPVHPDEPLPFDKARVLEELWGGNEKGNFQATMDEDLRVLIDAGEQLARILMPMGVAASNNWAVAPYRTAKGASVVANDTHLPLEHPPIWMLLQLKAPGYHVAGVAMPGIPGIVAGYNGDVAWGMTMVMGDSQDVFIEQIRQIDGTDHYRYKGEWHPVTTRTEIFHVKGSDPVERTIASTRHGVLLNQALSSKPAHPLMPPETKSDFRLAVQTTLHEPDNSLEGMYALNTAADMDAAREAIRRIRFMNLNFIYGDADHIAWQVSGRYPVRKNGRGHLPSPGWTGEYDWEGFLPVDQHPHAMDPVPGYLYTANHRTIDPGQGPVLGSSWYAPERAERIRQLLSTDDAYDFRAAVEMQNDRHDVMVKKLQDLFFDSPTAGEIVEAIEGLDDLRRVENARLASDILRDFDGNMAADASGAAIYGIFFHALTRNLFEDELGPDDSNAWQSFRSLNRGIYGPVQDHLFERPESPFWNDIHTPDKSETRAEIIASSLADAAAYAREKMGRNPEDWQWGKIHAYTWRTPTTKMRNQFPLLQRFGAWMISRYTDRGPYPAGGGFNTINVAAYHRGENFDVWLIPAMRMVVDFGRDEPLFLVNSGGQSGNPASPHYDDGIPVFLSGSNRQMAYRPENIRNQYKNVFTLQALQQ